MMLAAISFALYLFGFAWRPFIFLGFLVQSGYLLGRGLSLGRLPLVGVHDTLNFLSASIVAFSLPVHFARRKDRGFIMTIAGIAAFFTVISLFQKPHSSALPPVLRTYWFELHVALSFFSYALFGIAAVLGALYLRGREAAIERLQYKAALVGYGLFSISMVFGGVWAYLAWGTYWLWTPKELWTVLLWVYYSLYLHGRLIPGWAGRPSAALGIGGFAVVMFTYMGVGLLMKSSHTF